MNEEIKLLAEQVVKEFSAAGMSMTTAESCTGGLIAGAITSVSGSSAMFNQGYITYANNAKAGLLDVDQDTLNTQGAVSPEVASQMAQGALENADADAAVAVTGIAGPTGGTDEKPVGLVYIAVAVGDEEGAFVERHEFGDIGREKVREHTVIQALEMLLGYGIDDPAV